MAAKQPLLVTMRSRQELVFRLRQEAANLWMLAAPPRLPHSIAIPSHLPPLPALADEVQCSADLILQHRFRLLGFEIETGPTIDWRRDYVNGISSGTAYFRQIPYLDFARVGDHKVVWELNRHQHLVFLAQAHRLTGRQEFLSEIWAQLESWFQQNPFLRGINWTSALEVAFRAISWIWMWRLAGDQMPDALRKWFLTSLYRHGRYLEHNLSIYFSPNTHLLGEAVALHALGVLFPEFPHALNWGQTGAQLVRQQMDAQVREDGSHFEQSSYYHVYALDFFNLHAILGRPDGAYCAKLLRMAEYLRALMGPSRSLPLIGDDDGGCVLYPYGARDHFGAQQSRLFSGAGIAVMSAGDLHCLIDAGPFGPGSAGHSHSDTLSLVVRAGKEEILVDAGTYTYVSDPKWRNWFRGSAAHNTIRVDGMDQAMPAGPFRWTGAPKITIHKWDSSPERDFLDAACSYRGFTHRRRALLIKPDLLFILDDVDGPHGEHLVEQFWHVGERADGLSQFCFQIGSRAVLVLAGPAAADLSSGGEYGWRSRKLGQKEATQAIRAYETSILPVRWAAALDLSGKGLSALSVYIEDSQVCLSLTGSRNCLVRLPD